jgi:lisH domain-containing protein FOPNL
MEDLKTVVNDALDNKGVINELKSKLRAEIFTILEDSSSPKPVMSQENLLINELIRDYMTFNHYNYSKSVFLKETNQPTEQLDRDVIAAELHIQENKTSRQV